MWIPALDSATTPGPVPGPAPGDLERRLNALLEAAGLGVRVRLFRPPPGEPRVVLRRAAGFLPGTPGLPSREHLG